MPRSIVAPTRAVVASSMKPMPVYENGTMRWLALWALIINFVFFAYISIVAGLYLGAPTGMGKRTYRSCSRPLAIFLFSTGVANFGLSALRFVNVKIGSVLSVTANIGLGVFGGIIYFSDFQSKYPAKLTDELYCNFTVFFLSKVCVFFLIAYVALQIVLLSLIFCLEEKASAERHRGHEGR